VAGGFNTNPMQQRGENQRIREFLARASGWYEIHRIKHSQNNFSIKIKRSVPKKHAIFSGIY
jgi:hypothetical protein